MIDYATLKLIWWLLVGALLVGFAIMDGHDMGVGALLPFVGKNDTERRVIINTVGPHWDGNQVWFITAGGALFAAWPLVYAAAFSGFYFAMLVVLWALFFRPVGFDYRSKLKDARWRSFWDWGIFVGSAVPPLVFGVAIGNVIQGVPFHFSEELVVHYTGSFLALFSPFSLLCGVVSVSLLLAHGANYLALRTDGAIQSRASRVSVGATILFLVTFGLAGMAIASMPGYVITSAVDPGGAQSPLGKSVIQEAGAWLSNFRTHTWTMAMPALGFLGGLAGLLAIARRRPGMAFAGSAIAVIGAIFTFGVSLFPFVLPSSTDGSSSLTVWDCVSSHRTLNVMFWVAIIMTPIIVAYTTWAYRTMRGKVTVEYVSANDRSVY